MLVVNDSLVRLTFFDEFSNCQIHKHGHRYPGHFLQGVQLPDPSAVNFGLVEIFIGSGGLSSHSLFMDYFGNGTYSH